MEERCWWKESVVYQIYPRSFRDSNGDGIGDLKGITEKMEYLKELGINVIWLSPVYQSPNDDNGYDISDYQNIMTEFGTMTDFDEMLECAHQAEIRVIMDLVVNHTSDEHKWFVESRKSQDNPYRDYYIWKKGKNGNPEQKEDAPNNWGSCFSGSAWKYDEQTEMYFLHMFSTKQPDLNWENEKVRKEIYEMMNWWGNKGIDGFRMDVISMISKNTDYPDGEVTNGLYRDGTVYVNNGPKVHDYLKEMNQNVISNFDWMTVGEGAGVDCKEALNYAGYNRNELNMMFHFEHVNLGQGPYGKWCEGKVKLTELKEVMSKWQNQLEGEAWNSLYWDNHDQPRAVSRFGNDLEEYRVRSAKMLATCLHFMKGTPYIFQGEELGMTNNKCSGFDEFRDIEIKNAYHELVEGGEIEEQDMLHFVNRMGRDNARFPMQWDDSANAGFTVGEPWIGVNSNYKWINAKMQIHDADSVFSYYKELIALRHKMEIMVYGKYQLLFPESEELFVYTRTDQMEKLLVICNFTNEEIVYCLPDDFFDVKEVVISNYKDAMIFSKNVTMRAYEAVVLRKNS